MIAIVTDSTIYVTKQQASELGIHVVPMTYAANGHVFHELYSDANGEYLKHLSNKCTTSQVSTAAFMSTFAELRRQNYEILCLVISSRLSGTYSSAMIAAREVDEKNIRIVDTRTVGGGIKFLAECAKELIAENKPLEEIAAVLEHEREKISIVFSVENLGPLRNSGRMGFIRQSMGTILNIRPVLRCSEGTVTSWEYSRGRNQQIEKLIGAIDKNAKKIVIHYLGNKDIAYALSDAIRSRFSFVEPTIQQLGPVLGIHLGVPAFGIVWMT